MYERDDEALPPNQSGKTQDPIQELKNTAFLMSGLYQQLEAERSIITTASGQMTHAGKVFANYIKQFAELDKQLQATITQATQESAEKAANVVADTVGNKVADAATEQVEVVIEDLRKAANEAAAQLRDYRQTLEISTYWRWGGFIAIALLSGLLSAMTIHHYFPEQAFTNEQWNQLDAGKTLIKAWDKLEKKEQNKILKLGKDNIS